MQVRLLIFELLQLSTLPPAALAFLFLGRSAWLGDDDDNEMSMTAEAGFWDAGEEGSRYNEGGVANCGEGKSGVGVRELVSEGEDAAVVVEEVEEEGERDSEDEEAEGVPVEASSVVDCACACAAAESKEVRVLPLTPHARTISRPRPA